jgi:hypothetical protein
LGSYAVLSIICCAVVTYLFMARQRATAFWVLAAVGGGVLLSNVLKLAYERPRPVSETRMSASGTSATLKRRGSMSGSVPLSDIKA